MKKVSLLFLSLISLFSLKCYSDSIPPSHIFNLSNWKLQIPGPIEIKKLKNYASSYFYLNSDSSICFDLNAEEKGHTKNSKFVRSELRHLLNWSIEEDHHLSATIKISCTIDEYQVTVAQIHGITSLNENAPPLLRIAMVHEDLYAFLKTDSAGNNTERTLLRSGVKNDYFKLDIKNKGRILKIYIDGKECLNKRLDYWKYNNYYKLGCYPQVKKGNFKIYIRSFEVE